MKELIRSFFMKVPLPPNIDKIICFDLGSFSQSGATDSAGESINRSFLHIAVRAVAGAIKMRQHHPVSVFVQDPSYTRNEEMILLRNDYEVVGRYGARGFAMIDETTMVFSPHPKTCVKEIVAEIAKPAAMFWTPVLPVELRERESNIMHEISDNKNGYGVYVIPRVDPNFPFISNTDELILHSDDDPDPDTPRVLEFIKSYNSSPFHLSDLFGPVTLYTRKTSDPNGTSPTRSNGLGGYNGLAVPGEKPSTNSKGKGKAPLRGG
ncbi:hypothetical protein F4779DRAFT_481146 [Xylariaceae sp. FL0662B]|nr:hypothetical protein F4779DRAFT_481146 [Xylariaceae sp. FL0662B]